MKVKISCAGCDDTTTVEMEMDPAEVEAVRKVAAAITSASTYGCMPTMEVEEVVDGLAE